MSAKYDIDGRSLMKLVLNAAQCYTCMDIIESAYRHDFVSCTCGATSVDGGLDYARRVGDLHGYEELSVWIPF